MFRLKILSIIEQSCGFIVSVIKSCYICSVYVSTQQSEVKQYYPRAY